MRNSLAKIAKNAKKNSELSELPDLAILARVYPFFISRAAMSRVTSATPPSLM
jgi:hypothetical protein